MAKTWLSETIKKMYLGGIKIKAAYLGTAKVFAGIEPISGSTRGSVYAATYNGVGNTIYSGEIDVTDYSSVDVYGAISGVDNNLGNGGCICKIGLTGAISKSSETTAYEGSTSTAGKAAASRSATWDLTGVTGKVKVYCYFTCYTANTSGAYTSANLSWTFNP